MRMLSKTQMAIADLVADGTLTPENVESEITSRFPQATVGDLRIGIEAGVELLEERAMRAEREKEALSYAAQLFEGMPKGLELGECARIKAKQGDPIALAFLEWEKQQAGGLQ